MDNRFIRAEEVAAELEVSKPYAYKLIRRLNKEMEERGASPGPGGSAARTSRGVRSGQGGFRCR